MMVMVMMAVMAMTTIIRKHLELDQRPFDESRDYDADVDDDRDNGDGNDDDDDGDHCDDDVDDDDRDGHDNHKETP